jgi:hypothetical protein
MARPQCPICAGEFETRDVAPCAQCGAWPHEVDHFVNAYVVEGAGGKKSMQRHTYARWEVFPGLELVLCDQCSLEFHSYDPVQFGPAAPAVKSPSRMRFIRMIQEPSLDKDQVCPTCMYSLAYLRFLTEARSRYGG